MSSKKRPQYIVLQLRFVHINYRTYNFGVFIPSPIFFNNKIYGFVKSLFYFFRFSFCFLSYARNMQNFWLNSFI